MSVEILPELNTDTKLCPQYKVLLHNDDHNDMYFVMACLMKVFSFSPEKSFGIMREAHEQGLALCKVEPKEHAEFHQEQLQSFGLTVTIEPEG